MRIYNRKQESKKKRKENTLSTKKTIKKKVFSWPRAFFLLFFDRYRFFLFFDRFVARERVFFLFSFFLDRFLGRMRVFLFSFINKVPWWEQCNDNRPTDQPTDGRRRTNASLSVARSVC